MGLLIYLNFFDIMNSREKLKQAVKDLKDKISSRRQSITQKIKAIDEQITVLQNNANILRQNMVEAELSGEVDTAEQQEQIKQLKADIAELEERKAAYGAAVNSDYVREFSEIKKLAKAAMSERQQEIEKLRSEEQEHDRKISELTKRKRELNNKLHHLVRFEYIESELIPLLESIDARAKKRLHHYEQQDFVKTWINNGDLEAFFPEQKPSGPIDCMVSETIYKPMPIPGKIMNMYGSDWRNN
ncbi:MAG: hypothetical protein H6Q67_483 [Firmicutes bacterium]|nr:hypothetical protein [Bacillota bacterium]